MSLEPTTIATSMITKNNCIVRFTKVVNGICLFYSKRFMSTNKNSHTLTFLKIGKFIKSSM